VVTQSLHAATLEKLRRDFRGQLILPGDREYDSQPGRLERDRRPLSALIARCTRVEDAAVDSMTVQVSTAPGECSIGLWAQGGATRHVDEDAMAFTGRGAAHWLGAEALWTERDRNQDHIAWGRTPMAALKPFTRAGHYVNDMVEQGEDVVRSINGNAKYERLRGLKRARDPDNVFRLNQNIRP
jgi:hypothetical protein